MKRDGDSETNCNWHVWNSPQRLGNRIRRLGNQRTNQDHPVYVTVEISQNTEKRPVDLKRLALTRTPAKDPQLTAVWKTHKEYHHNKNIKKEYLRRRRKLFETKLIKGILTRAVLLVRYSGVLFDRQGRNSDKWIKWQENWWLCKRC